MYNLELVFMQFVAEIKFISDAVNESNTNVQTAIIVSSITVALTVIMTYFANTYNQVKIRLNKHYLNIETIRINNIIEDKLSSDKLMISKKEEMRILSKMIISIRRIYTESSLYVDFVGYLRMKKLYEIYSKFMTYPIQIFNTNNFEGDLEDIDDDQIKFYNAKIINIQKQGAYFLNTYSVYVQETINRGVISFELLLLLNKIISKFVYIKKKLNGLIQYNVNNNKIKTNLKNYLKNLSNNGKTIENPMNLLLQILGYYKVPRNQSKTKASEKLLSEMFFIYEKLYYIVEYNKKISSYALFQKLLKPIILICKRFKMLDEINFIQFSLIKHKNKYLQFENDIYLDYKFDEVDISDATLILTSLEKNYVTNIEKELSDFIVENYLLLNYKCPKCNKYGLIYPLKKSVNKIYCINCGGEIKKRNKIDQKIKKLSKKGE